MKILSLMFCAQKMREKTVFTRAVVKCSNVVWVKKVKKKKTRSWDRPSAPCKRIGWILESRKFLLVESGIQQILAIEFGILDFEMWNTAHMESGTAHPLTIGWNPGIQVPSTKKSAGIQYLESIIHGVESRIQIFLLFSYVGRDPQ